MVIQEGLRRVMDYAQAHAPEGTRLEWRPMDVAGSYPLQATTRARKSQVLLRLSKNDLARCAQPDDRWQDIRSVVAQHVSYLS
jgi:hypothetical protein